MNHNESTAAEAAAPDTESPDTLLPNGLTRAQQANVDKALAYVRELQSTVFKDAVEEARKRMREQLPVGTLNPGLQSGEIDARNLSVMSRIYVGSINFELTEEHIHRVFAEFGSISNVSMSKDAATGRHKGYGFVEYEIPEAAALAIETMNGTMLGGRQLRIGRPHNYEAAVVHGFPTAPDTRIYVANVNEAIVEESLKEIFAPFGEIKQCALAPDFATRKHRGWGFIEFAEASAAGQAALAMNKFSLGNLVLRVCKCSVGGPLGKGMAALDDATSPAMAGQPSPAVKPPPQVVAVAANITKSIAKELSPIVLLTNVVGGRSEVDDDLAADMADEGEKCGKIVKVVVHLATERELSGSQSHAGENEVKIFIHYADTAAAAGAVEVFDHRWFGGRQISAQHYDLDRYRQETSADTMVYIP